MNSKDSGSKVTNVTENVFDRIKTRMSTNSFSSAFSDEELAKYSSVKEQKTKKSLIKNVRFRINSFSY